MAGLMDPGRFCYQFPIPGMQTWDQLPGRASSSQHLPTCPSSCLRKGHTVSESGLLRWAGQQAAGGLRWAAASGTGWKHTKPTNLPAMCMCDFQRLPLKRGVSAGNRLCMVTSAVPILEEITQSCHGQEKVHSLTVFSTYPGWKAHDFPLKLDPLHSGDPTSCFERVYFLRVYPPAVVKLRCYYKTKPLRAETHLNAAGVPAIWGLG